MKYKIKKFRNLTVALKEMERFIKDGEHLQTGKALYQFGDLRSREILANWLLCAVKSHADGASYTFTTDPTGSDGIIVAETTTEAWPTEHIIIPRHQGGAGTDIHKLVLDAIEKKRIRGGSAYASGKNLLVFMNAAGSEWFPNRVAKALPQPLHFETVWTVGLQRIEKGAYVYGVALLDVTDGNAPTFSVRIAADFAGWTVERLQ